MENTRALEFSEIEPGMVVRVLLQEEGEGTLLAKGSYDELARYDNGTAAEAIASGDMRKTELVALMSPGGGVGIFQYGVCDEGEVVVVAHLIWCVEKRLLTPHKVGSVVPVQVVFDE